MLPDSFFLHHPHKRKNESGSRDYLEALLYVYVQIFKGCKFQSFHSQLAMVICKAFILEILLAKLLLALIGEQDTLEW